jgi:hypothetical protein
MQVLNSLAPAHTLAADAVGAEQMLASACTLAKSMHDLPSQARAHKYMLYHLQSLRETP